jgi:tetratricopeptide (TPR) repeat protein
VAPAADAEAQAEADRYFSRAEQAFREADFRNAMRLAAHAAIDNPEDADVHLLLSLAMFAQGDYQGAAMEARGLAAMGKIPNWDTVFGMYGQLEPYEKQLRALEQFVGKNQAAPEARFLLGFHYAMAGHREAAQQEFLAALNAVPEDTLTADLLTHVGGRVPADIARRQSEAVAQPQGKPSGPAQGKPPAPPQGTPSRQPRAQPPAAAPTEAAEPTIPPPPVRK